MAALSPGAPADPMDKYDVVWDSPSQNHTGSMPIGNGDIGLNVWMEPNGDLLLLIAKTDAWSETSELLKLGRLRISFFPNPLDDGGAFQQVLRLRQGEIAIRAGKPDKDISLRIWVDANRPVVRIESEGPVAFDMKVKLELWRNAEWKGPHEPVCPHPDTVLPSANRIVWYHRNESSIWAENLTFQGLADFIPSAKDPLLHRTFGGCVTGEGMVSEDATTLISREPRKQFDLSIHVLCEQTETAAEWAEQLDLLVAENDALPLDTAREAHAAWWKEFWDRSWIRITGSEEAEIVSRAYTLQRWINACGGRGNAAIKFNGSIFSVGQDDSRKQRFGIDDPDYRRWGGQYWWQNTRLPYWPMPACGDYDLMRPLFKMCQDMVPIEKLRTNVWFGHSGAFISETIYFWGMVNDGTFGIPFDERAEKGLPPGEMLGKWAGYIRREYTASPELMAMLLDYYDYTRDDQFLTETLLPMCDALLEFWDKHYSSDETGRMDMYPAQVLETYWDARNPTPDVAGLRWVLQRLMELPEGKAGTARREFWKGLAAKVPPIPTGGQDGRKHVLPAAWTDDKRHNDENGELYAVWPFRIYGVGKPDLDVGRLTFELLKAPGDSGWLQVGIQAAYLGLTEKAAADVVSRARNKDESSRFPAFWVDHADWIPNQCHGGNLMTELQAMLMQTDGGRILLLPAWPKEWDVDFKLHAPRRTIVQGTVKGGKVISLSTDPPDRAAQIEVIRK